MMVFRVANHLLSSLSSEELGRVAAHSTKVRLKRGAVLHEAGSLVQRVYFPESGAISLVVGLASGETIETALIGVDGVVGGHDAIDSVTALNRAVVQIEGSALALDAAMLKMVAGKSVHLRQLLDRYARFVSAQAQQSAACNAAHSLEARLACWLLRAQDVCGNEFVLTQEALAAFLGVRRTSVSTAAHDFRKAGMIRYRRGAIEIVDGEALAEISCECHATLTASRKQLLPLPAAIAAYAQVNGQMSNRAQMPRRQA